ncbi:MAG: 3'-5' exonuclease, partial [Marinirhabdus sp.]|nr:3'-5' exonuclease [Marinirhabdus sp.]
HELYGQRVLGTVSDLLGQGYALNDICILTRTKKEGISLSEFLLANDVAVVSSETLLLQHSKLVQCVLSAQIVALSYDNDTAKVLFLNYLYDLHQVNIPKHDFLQQGLAAKGAEFSEVLNAYDIKISLSEINEKPLYESFEYIIKSLNLNTSADAYLFAFMDMVLDFQAQPQAGKTAFLDYWETKKDTASIPANNSQNALQIMTIHKSKGLEFPIVIYPYATTKLYTELNAKAWYPVHTNGFEEVLINYNSEVAHYGSYGEEMTQTRRNTLELDNINLLYVTLTRAVEQLFIFSECPSKIKDAPTDFSQLLRSYLENEGLWNDEQRMYAFGSSMHMNINRDSTHSASIKSTTLTYPTSTPESHQLSVVRTDASLWQSEALRAITSGNMLHDTMEKIRTQSDVSVVFDAYRERGTFEPEELTQLEAVVKNIVNHPELRHLFSDELPRNQIYLERDIVTANKQIVRPDRLNFFNNHSVTIVDYKTGAPKTIHEQQILEYADTLKNMGYAVNESMLIYSNESQISINKI